KVTIAKKDWEKYGIPELEVNEWIGSFWWVWDYNVVKPYLHKKGYESDGKRYACDHGYPALIQGDPHDRRITELEDSDDEDSGDEEPSPSSSQLASPSTFSLINTPTQSEVMHKEKCLIPAILVKGFGLWTRKNTASPKPKQKRNSEIVNSRGPTDVPDEWDLVDTQDL
ncbi:hypothetical protein AAF712_016485, partial [Marasmius tenuissimus]